MLYETTGMCWRLTNFYGHLETSKCEENWTLLESLKQSNHLPCLCVLVILMRLQVSLRKQADAYDQLTKWITSASPSTAVISLTLDTLALPSLSPTTTLLKAAFV